MKKIIILFSVLLLAVAPICLSQNSQDSQENRKLSALQPKVGDPTIAPRSMEPATEQSQPSSSDSGETAQKVRESEKNTKEPGPQTQIVAKPQEDRLFNDTRGMNERILSRGTGRSTQPTLDTFGNEQTFAAPGSASTEADLDYSTVNAFSKLVDNGIEINTALVRAEKTVHVSAGIAGLLTRLAVPQIDPNTNEPVLDANGDPIMIEVKEGMEVYADQEIGTIDDSVEVNRVKAANAMLRVAKAESEKIIEIQYAKAALDVAEALVEKNAIMNKRIPGTVPDQNVLEAKLQAYQAKKQLEKSTYDLLTIKPEEENVKVQELAIATTTLQQRRLKSPVNGIVDEMIGYPGEWFREGDNILRITQFDMVRVLGRVNIDHAIPAMLADRPVTVIMPALRHQPSYEVQGKVIFVDQTIQPGDRHFLIHVGIKNEKRNGFWLINPGLYVDLKIALD